MSKLPPQGANVPFSSLGDTLDCTPVDLVAEDGAPSRGLFVRRRGTQPKVGVHLMHPRTDQSLNYNIGPLAQAGYAVLGRSGRSVNNDTDTVHEELLLDVAAGVKYLRDAGCEQVVLLGNSGGGSLACLYQYQATTPPQNRLQPLLPYTKVDLAKSDLAAADALALVGIHIGEGLILSNMLDPAVVDEGDPLATNPHLDMYDPGNGFRLPLSEVRYDEDFLHRHKLGQIERVRRLDAIARASIERQLEAGELASLESSDHRRLRLEREAKQSRYMVIYRTVAYPAMADCSIDPDDRLIGGPGGNQRPDLQNWSDAGFAHCLTPRAWLSTWSALTSHARTGRSLASIKEPTLIVHYAGDVFTRLSEARELANASAAQDTDFVVVRNTDHYGKVISSGKAGPQRSSAGTEAVLNWMRQRFPLD